MGNASFMIDYPILSSDRRRLSHSAISGIPFSFESSSSIQARVIFYFHSVINQEMQYQRHGVVYVHINIGEDMIEEPPDLYVAGVDVALACPTRIDSNLLFVRPESTEFTSDIFHATGNHNQVRIQLHRLQPNDFNKMHFILSTVGIPVECLPVSKEGALDLTWHNQFLKSRRLVEEATARAADGDKNASISSPLVDLGGTSSPSQNDVLCGVESLARTHIGNFKYLSYIESHFDEYNAIEDRLQRKAFFEKVFAVVQKSGGRFLQRSKTTGLWVPVEDSVALEKIGNSFRTRRKKGKRSGKSQKNQKKK